MFIEVENMGIKGGPIKVLIAADAIEEINLGNDEMTSFIMLRGGRQIHIAQDREGIVAQLREFKLLAAEKADPEKVERLQQEDGAKRAEALKYAGAIPR